MATTKTIAYCSLNIATDEVQTIATFDMNANSQFFTDLELTYKFITFFNVPTGIVVILEWDQYDVDGRSSVGASAFFLELDGDQLVMTRKKESLYFYEESGVRYRASNYFHDAVNNAIVWVSFEGVEGGQTTVMNTFNYNTFGTVGGYPISNYLNYSNDDALQISHSNVDHIIFFQLSYLSEIYVPPQLFYVERTQVAEDPRPMVDVPAQPSFWYGIDSSGFHYFDTGVGQMIAEGDLQMVSPDTFGASGSNNTTSAYEPAKSNLISYFRAKV